MKKLFTSLLSTIVVVVISSTQIVGATGITSDADSAIKSSEEKMLIPTEDNNKLEVSIEETDSEYIVTSYLNGEITSTTIKNKETRNMKTTDQNGKVEYANESDYITKEDSGLFLDEEKTITSDSISSKASGNWTFVASAYNPHPNVKTWGYLYKQESISYGQTYYLNFGPNTAISTFIGALAGLITVSTPVGIIGAIVTALGTAIVTDTVIGSTTGQVYGRFTAQDLEARSNGKVGIRSKRTFVDAKVINSKNGNVQWIPIRTEGDSRSDSDLCIMGAYNVALFN